MTLPFGAPPPRKPSILDRVAARLFPTAAYTGLLDPSQQEGLQRQGLLNVGLNLMQAGGASPQQHGTLANIGAAIQGVNFPEMAQHALQLQAYQSQRAGEQAVAQVVAQHPAKPGESQSDSYNRLFQIMMEISAIPGIGVATADKMAPILAAMKQNRPERREPMRIPGVNTKLGTAGIGQSGTLLIDPDTMQQIGFVPGAPKALKEPTPQERVAGSQFDSAKDSIAAMREIATRHPEAAKMAVAALQAGGWGKLGKAYAAVRGLTSDPDAQRFYTEYENMLLTVTPTYGGARPTQQLLDLERSASLPALGSGNFDAAFAHMDHRLLDLKAKAGRGLQVQAPSGHRPNNPFAL